MMLLVPCEAGQVAAQIDKDDQESWRPAHKWPEESRTKAKNKSVKRTKMERSMLIDPSVFKRKVQNLRNSYVK